MKTYRIPVEQFDDLITQMSCSVVQHEIDEVRAGVTKSKDGTERPIIKKFVKFSFENESDENTWKKLKGVE